MLVPVRVYYIIGERSQASGFEYTYSLILKFAPLTSGFGQFPITVIIMIDHRLSLTFSNSPSKYSRPGHAVSIRRQ